MTQLPLDLARMAKKMGIAQVAAKNSVWVSTALPMLAKMRHEFPETTGEGIRFWLRRCGLPEPTHVNAWGALINTAAKRGLIVDTERTVRASTEKSHARRTPVWRFV